MTLPTEVQARYGAEYLITITNPQSEGATTIDSTRLANACTDVEAAFVLESAATAFDINNAQHVAIAVEGVVGFLLRRLGTYSEEAERRIREFRSNLKSLASIDQRDYVSPAGVPEEARMPRSAGKHVIPRRPNRGRFGGNLNQIEAD
jgi:hypothetical protein